MIPANCVDKFKGLKIANNGFTGADLRADFGRQNNSLWNGRVSYWFSQINMMNWLLRVLTAALVIDSSTLRGRRQPIPAADVHVCAVAERWTHRSSLRAICLSVISGAKDLPLVTMTIFIPTQKDMVSSCMSQGRKTRFLFKTEVEECFWFNIKAKVSEEHRRNFSHPSHNFSHNVRRFGLLLAYWRWFTPKAAH